ncbi:MAG: hypothetical protein E6J74_11960 [Deltaproteobacteria bacterium]|nr:MAG: hypothetical protein E6J74_11960 [Deltaproteobacteria bacterium]
MNPTTHRKLNIVAATGLAIGAVFGLAGTIVTHSHLQATLWAIDSVGLVMATTLLTVKFLRKGCDVIAAGFLVFAIGEGVILSGTAAGLVGSIPSFAAGIALWAAALLLISIPNEFSMWVRVIGIATAILFAVTSARMFWGEPLLPTSSPLPFFGYPFLVITIVGWITYLLKEHGLTT